MWESSKYLDSSSSWSAALYSISRWLVETPWLILLNESHIKWFFHHTTIYLHLLDSNNSQHAHRLLGLFQRHLEIWREKRKKWASKGEGRDERGREWKWDREEKEISFKYGNCVFNLKLTTVVLRRLCFTLIRIETSSFLKAPRLTLYTKQKKINLTIHP